MSDREPEPDTAVTAAPTDLAALMDAAVDAIVLIEEDGRIVAFSRAAEAMFGYPADAMKGKPVSQLMPEPYRSRHADYILNFCQTGKPQIIGTGRRVKAIRSTGEIFPVWLSVGESRSESGRHFVGIIRDLSDQQRAENERHSLEQRLAHVSRLSLLGEMAAGIAHEINQPLTAIASYSEAARNLLANESPDSETLRKACTGIGEQVQRAGEVIQNLRKFVRKREIEKQPLDLQELIEGAMVLVNADATHEGVPVETKLASALPAVFGNAVQLQQVLLNLTRNAVDAMRGNTDRRKELLIETAASGADFVEFRVSDRGPGVAASLADAIFHPFFTTKQEGLGVGLAISRSIIDAHGGRLSFEDRSGGGSTFIVRLPILKASDERH